MNIEQQRGSDTQPDSEGESMKGKNRRDLLLTIVFSICLLAAYFFVVILFNPGVCNVIQ